MHNEEHVDFFAIAIASLFMLSGCAQNDKHLEQRCDSLRAEISDLEAQKKAVEAEIADAKEENGTAKYVITFCIRQSHFTLDINEHIKDAMNEITPEVPVDKEYYDTVSVGDVLSDDFRMGSLIMRGSFGSWKVTVKEKHIK